jgi:mono/diheme cytochrome c family protein/outer membrane lipoprotein-sorting protein
MTIHMLRSLTVALALLTPLVAEDSRGKVLYNQLCFTCHGQHLEGGIGPSLKDDYWRHGDSPEAILEVITNGVEGSEMLTFKEVYPEEDRIALRDYIVGEQEGMRSLVRSHYPRAHFKGKRFSPDQLKTIEATSQTPLQENLLHVKNNTDAVTHASATLYIKTPGKYQYSVRPIGRTSIFLDGEEVTYFDSATPKESHFNKSFTLKPGTYDLEFFHEEPRTHGYKFFAQLIYPDRRRQNLNGRSLQGNIPKVIAAGAEAKVIRKWIKGISPRTLLCLLPNKVIVAFNPDTGQVESAWKGARVNQTPSLPDRSQQPSVIEGTPIAAQGSLPADLTVRHRAYKTDGSDVVIHSEVDGEPRTITISPQGDEGYQIR